MLQTFFEVKWIVLENFAQNINMFANYLNHEEI